MYEHTSIYLNQIEYSRESTLKLHDVHSTSPFFSRHQRPGWVQLLAIFSCNRLGVDMSRYKPSLNVRDVYMRDSMNSFSSQLKKKQTPDGSKGIINKKRRFRKSTSCKAEKPLGFDDKVSIIIGAGFWPLAGCSASQPLPKMWEAWFIPLMCHVISSQRSCDQNHRAQGPRLPHRIRMLVVWIPWWAIGRERPVQLMPRCRHGGYEWHHPPPNWLQQHPCESITRLCFS